MGLNVVMITLPEPAKPCLIPIKEKTINEIFKTELPATYFMAFGVKEMGFLK
jgi:hypothetical protein